MAVLDVTRALRYRGALKITLDNQAGSESFTVETPSGLKLELRAGPGGIQIADTNGNSVNFDPSGIAVNAASKVTLNASMVEISAAAINVDAGITTFSGIVKCNQLITNSVISHSYTPGQGNIW